MKEWLKTIYTSPAKTLRAFCVVFVAAVAFASLPQGYGVPKAALTVIFGGMFFCLSLAILSMNKKSVRFGFLMLVAILFGVWRFGVAEIGSTCKYSDYFCKMGDSNVSTIGKIIEAPSERLGYTQYVVKPNDLGAETPILVLAGRFPKFNYGDTVSLDCKLKAPVNEPGSTFNYVKYLESRGIGAICSYPKSFELYSKGEPSLYNFILNVKEKLSQEVEKLWPDPAASLMAGILYGERSSLPQNIKDQFSIAGLSHIVAVSGFNVSIIAISIMIILRAFGVKRGVAAWMAMVLIWLFVIFVGASAAAVRAGVMASVVMLAERLGRLSDPGGALIFAAFLMTLQNPYIIMWDVGFQLSFVATAGLIYGTPIIERMIRNRVIGNKEIVKHRSAKRLVLPDFVVELAATTLAAIVATAPLLLYYFGKLSSLSLVANILVVPVVPWLMLVGSIAIVFGFIFFPLGYAVAFVANVGLNYILAVVHIFGTPNLAIDLSVPWWGVVILYVFYFFSLSKIERIG